jgi:hypothetical protein
MSCHLVAELVERCDSRRIKADGMLSGLSRVVAEKKEPASGPP